MNENILKYKVQKKKLNSNNAKDVAFQDMVVLSNEVKFLEVSESVRGTNENKLKYKIKSITPRTFHNSMYTLLSFHIYPHSISHLLKWKTTQGCHWN